ncbi:hypothetical protein Tco_0337821 [Tanacetum coccineum]
MEEYIRLEEEKARKHGKVYNWETAKYSKIWYDEDVHDLISVETKFPAIVFNDMITSDAALSCEPTVSSLNDEIDFRISFDDSDDEDYTVVFNKNSFSYKIISTNDLKTNSENDNEKVNIPSFLPPEPTVNCFDDLYFFNDFENEFPATVYNDDLTSKSDFSTKPVVSVFTRTVYTAYPNPMDTADRLSGRYPVFIFSTVDTAYSLNEYSVFNTGINMVYRLPVQVLGPREGNSTYIGEVSTSLEVLES